MDLHGRIRASILCSAIGDAIGYRNGQWEFCFKGPVIHEQMEREFGSVAGIQVTPDDFMLSDDTVMSMATAEALINAFPAHPEAKFTDPTFAPELDAVMVELQKQYVLCMKDMGGRAAGPMTIQSCIKLEQGVRWDAMPFDPRSGGCGGSMRAAPIGLCLYGPARRPFLVALGIEAGRITHSHPTGFLGSLAVASFAAFAIEGLVVNNWGCHFLTEIIPLAKEYLQNSRDWALVKPAMLPFLQKMTTYLKARGIATVGGTPTWPAAFGVAERDAFYTSLSFDGWGGASGDDSVIIAYDALLGSKGSWPTFVLNGVLHGGDSDSTGTIGGALFGALYGLGTVPLCHYAKIEYHDRLLDLAGRIATIKATASSPGRRMSRQLDRTPSYAKTNHSFSDSASMRRLRFRFGPQHGGQQTPPPSYRKNDTFSPGGKHRLRGLFHRISHSEER